MQLVGLPLLLLLGLPRLIGHCLVNGMLLQLLLWLLTGSERGLLVSHWGWLRRLMYPMVIESNQQARYWHYRVTR